jgi:hypothetical protein
MFDKLVTFGLTVGNRSFFPSGSCEAGHGIILRVLEEEVFKTIDLSPGETPHGSVKYIE